MLKECIATKKKPVFKINSEDLLIREKTLKDPNARGAKALKKRFRQIFEDEEDKKEEEKKMEQEVNQQLKQIKMEEEKI